MDQIVEGFKLTVSAEFDGLRINVIYSEQSQPKLKLRLAKAERAGFEPAIEFPLYTLSRRASSTTRAPLRKGCKNTFLILSSRIFFVHWRW